MALEYLIDLKKDLVTQFREQPNIDILVDAIQEQLKDVCVFYEQLRGLRSVYTAYGQQLDGVGQIAVLSRAEAGEMALYKESTSVLSDEEYRKYLIFKIWKNTNTCTYEDIQTAFRMFWDKPLYYSEYPNQHFPWDEALVGTAITGDSYTSTQYPATMVFESSVCKPEDHVEKLFDLPFIKAAGVAVIIIAYTEAEEMQYTLSANSYLGRGYMETTLPEAFLIGSLIVWTENGNELHILWDKLNAYGSGENINIESTEIEVDGKKERIYIFSKDRKLIFGADEGINIIDNGIYVHTAGTSLYIDSDFVKSGEN